MKNALAHSIAYIIAMFLASIGAFVIKVSLEGKGGEVLLFTLLGLFLVFVAALIIFLVIIRSRKEKYTRLHAGHSVR